MKNIKIGGERILYSDCADGRLLEESNVRNMCKSLGVERGEFKRIRLLGASEPIARRSRAGGDLSLFEEQFREAAAMGVEVNGFGHHSDCQWYKAILAKRISEAGLAFSYVEPFYSQIERAVQFIDMLETYSWVMKHSWFSECILTFAYQVGKETKFVFEALPVSDIAQEIKSLKQELSTDFTQEQLACIGVI